MVKKCDARYVQTLTSQKIARQVRRVFSHLLGATYTLESKAKSEVPPLNVMSGEGMLGARCWLIFYNAK